MNQQSMPLCLHKTALSFLALPLIIGLAAISGCTKPVEYKSLPIGTLPAGSFQREWLAPLDVKKDAVDSIDVRNDVIYVFTKGKRVTAINRLPGTIRFSVQIETPSPRVLPPVELADKIVFPCTTSLEIYDKKGVYISSDPLTAPLHSGATGAIDTIYFGAYDPHGGRLLAVNLLVYNIPRWELLTKGAISSAPLIYSSILYCGTEAGEVYALNEDRNPVWSIEGSVFMTAGPITADIKADDAGVYVSCKDTNLYCINRTTGKLMWQYFAGAPLETSAVPTSDTVYQYVPGKGLVAIDKVTKMVNGDPRSSKEFNRTPRWIRPAATQFLSQDDTNAYVLEPRPDDKDPSVIHNVIVAVDKQTGKTAFESYHTRWTVFGTNTKDSLIYAGFANGQILAIRPILKAGHVGEMVVAPVEKPGDAVAMK